MCALWPIERAIGNTELYQNINIYNLMFYNKFTNDLFISDTSLDTNKNTFIYFY